MGETRHAEQPQSRAIGPARAPRSGASPGSNPGPSSSAGRSTSPGASPNARPGSNPGSSPARVPARVSAHVATRVPARLSAQVPARVATRVHAKTVCARCEIVRLGGHETRPRPRRHRKPNFGCCPERDAPFESKPNSKPKSKPGAVRFVPAACHRRIGPGVTPRRPLLPRGELGSDGVGAVDQQRDVEPSQLNSGGGRRRPLPESCTPER